MEATTTKRRGKARPFSHYWSLVKDMDDNQKLQLASMLLSSVKPARADGRTKKKLDARDYAGIWSDEEYMDADKLVDAIHDARHFKDRAKFWEEL